MTTKLEPPRYALTKAGITERWLSCCIQCDQFNYLLMRGGSRNAIAKNKTPIAQAKMSIYATASMILIKFLIPSPNSLPVKMKIVSGGRF